MLKRKGMLAVTYLCLTPAAFAFNVLVPLQLAYGIQAIITRDFVRVGHQALVVVLATLVGGIVFAIGTWTNHRVNVDGGSYIQRVVFANYLAKDYEFYSSRYIGALGADAVAMRNAYQEYSLMSTFDAPKAAVIIFVGLAVIIYKSPTLGLVSAACVLFVLLVTALIAGLRLKYRRVLSQASSQLAGMIGDPLSHGPAVKSFAQERHTLCASSHP
jgi:ABC-type multidrug transport system fused ATPase/permease subunit